MSLEFRLGLLVAVLSLAAGLELRLRGREASRWKEYLFLLGCGAAGALFGVANDLVTSRISPEYFILGKGVAEGTAFLAGVIRVGIEAGCSGGLIAGCVLLYANNPRPGFSRLPFPGLAGFIGRIMIFCASGALLAWLILRLTPLSRVRPDFLSGLTPVQASGFVRVWGMHLGLYAGLAVGTLFSWFKIRSVRN